MVILWKLNYERMICWEQYVVFFLEAVLLKSTWCIAGAEVWKDVWCSERVQVLPNRKWITHWFALLVFFRLCYQWSLLKTLCVLLAFVRLAFFTDPHLSRFHREECTKELLLVLPLPLLLARAHLQSLEVSSGSNCHCWFMNGVCEWIELPLLIHVNWTADILTTEIAIAPKNYF